MPDKPAVVELSNLRKTYGDLVANDAIHLKVLSGSVHAIVGENGAGKSTAMKMLYGQIEPDHGKILLNGKEVFWKSPLDAVDAGIGMVHQHFMLAEPHSVLENILLGWERSALFPANRMQAREKLAALMKEFSMPVDLDVMAGDLPVGLQQRVEILKLLFRESSILILDEPTAVLTANEIQALFRTLREMASQGKTVLIITHKLKEVMNLADRVTVFRAGKVVAEREVSETSPAELASLMVGRTIELGRVFARSKTENSKVLLQVSELEPTKLAKQLKKFSLSLHEGEILGIAGVEGNGQEELIQTILCPFRWRASGELQMDGVSLAKFAARKVRDAGIGIFPANRIREGMLSDFSVEENLLLGREEVFSKNGILDSEKMQKEFAEELKEFDVRPHRLDIAARSLSGGNQQKMVVARELSRNPRLLIAAQPTRGVDVGSIEFIHQKIMDLRNSGRAVLLISSELEEVLRLSDRILVIYGGRFVAEFSRADFREDRIGACMAGLAEGKA